MKFIFAILLMVFATRCAFAMSSTDLIEGPMQADTAALYGFPDNVLTLVNDWHRVYAWHPWFSELPNSAYFFAFNAPSMSHVNELLGYFGELKAKDLILDLSPAELAAISTQDEDALRRLAGGTDCRRSDGPEHLLRRP